MAEVQVLPPAMAQPQSANTSVRDRDGDDGEVWIHWKDPYWKTFDSRTPHPAHNTTTMPPNTTHNMDKLFAANHDLTVHFVPFLVILAVVLLITIVGNGLVCYLYRTRFRRNTDNFFVVFLAGLEIVVTLLGVPMEMAVLSLPLLFDSDAVCRIIHYVQTASVCIVLLVLSAIAVDRYWKLTHPTNFLSSVWALRLSLGAVLLGLGLAVPSPFVFGSKVIPTSIANVTGVACDLNNSSSGPAGIVYIVLLILSFFTTLLIVIVLYSIMLVRICRRKSVARGERVSPTRRKFPQTHRFGVSEESSGSYGGDETRPLPTSMSGSSSRMSPCNDPARVPLKSPTVTAKESTRIGQRNSPALDVQSTQMTWIFFGVTVWTVITITPFMVFRTLQITTDILENMQPLSIKVMYQIGVHLYLLHPPVVPIVYVFFNHIFRKEVRRLLQKLGITCKRETQSCENGTS